MPRYQSPSLQQLRDQQIRFSPRDARLRQIERAEEVLCELDPAGHYFFHALCEQITTFRPELVADEQIPGRAAIHDLRCLVEDLSESVGLTQETASEEVFTMEDVSREYRVSLKTVARWRNRGLVSRRFRMNGRTRVGFLRSSVERFVNRNADRVRRSSTFSQLTTDEREQFVRRARRMARWGANPTEIARRLARRFHRSPETVRYTLKRHDQDYPEAAVFPNAQAPLTAALKQELYRRFRQGEAPAALAERFNRTRTSVYRILSEIRAAHLTAQPIDYMDAPEFHVPGAAERILGPAPEVARKATSPRVPPGLPPYLASLYAIPLLTREEEAYHFRKMNFLKFQAATLQQKFDPAHPKSKDMDRMECLLDEASEVKNFLIRSNLRLVVSIAKKHLRPNTSFFEMVSDGNMSLIRAIEKFDYTKGFKFSTYSSWAIMKNYARTIPAEHTQLDRFRTGSDDVFYNSADRRAEHVNDEVVNQRQHRVIMNILDQLDPREREIIVFRYGLNEGAGPQTLEQVGTRFGVTKERIRQLEARALRKLRRIAEDEKIDIPGL